MASSASACGKVAPQKFKTLNGLEELFKACLDFDPEGSERQKMKDLKLTFKIDLKANLAYEMTVFLGKGHPKETDASTTIQGKRLAGVLKPSGASSRGGESDYKSVTVNESMEIQREIEKLQKEEDEDNKGHPL